MTSKVATRAYVSPSMVLLAMDWPDADARRDFLGFAIKRTPGFFNEAESWLPNRISFAAPTKEAVDHPSDEAPIQKFMWWDARFGSDHGGQRNYQYLVAPVCGTPASLTLVSDAQVELHLTLPDHVEEGIGTWFNRAVVSSQAFSGLLRKLGLTGNQTPSDAEALTLRSWLSNGMQDGLTGLIKDADELAGAIYHLADNLWIIPSLSEAGQSIPIDIIYDAVVKRDKSGDPITPVTEAVAIPKLQGKAIFHPRNKTHIMHNKFLVAGRRLNDEQHAMPARVTMGSANYTIEGLTSQANVVHTFEAADLAAAYLQRYALLKDNPTLAETAADARWSDTVTVSDAAIRVYFSPEPGNARKKQFQRESIDTVVRAIHEAKSSVLFCLFSPTDKPLRDACFAAGDRGRMMFGLLNNISDKSDQEVEEGMRADEQAAIELYHRSKENKDIVPAAYFRWDNKPDGFLSENQLFPGEGRPPYPPVIIHHKFIVIDGETDHPIIYSGSANMSKNSVNFNDENLLEIVGSHRLADIYLAEFFRLYEHYRARAHWVSVNVDHQPETQLVLKATRDEWASEYLTPGTPQFRARKTMVAGRL
jgi:phosphatidylserine/phosphatidylglycerophosphate/cardiolipin synthase-like enzyme